LLKEWSPALGLAILCVLSFADSDKRPISDLLKAGIGELKLFEINSNLPKALVDGILKSF
jgi:hypothetical protein